MVQGDDKDRNIERIKTKLVYDKNSVYAKAVKNVLDVLAGVLTLPQDLKATKIVFGELAKGVRGEYDPKRRKIIINSDLLSKVNVEEQVLQIVLHEVGHVIDVQVLNTLKAREKLLKKVRKSYEIDRLEHNLKIEKEKLLKLENDLFRDADEISQSRKKIERYEYLLQDNEMVARVLFQYFAKRSGNNEKVLDYVSKKGTVLEQFSEKAFAGITAVLEPILRKKRVIP